MKKNYMMPTTRVVEIKADRLLVQYSNGPAASDATVLSRESNSDWEDEEDDY